MARLIFIIFIFLFNCSLFSQEGNYSVPEYEKMRLQIFDNTSLYFYPKLFERYIEGDTSLSVLDFRFLYYGYTFQTSYIPYQTSRYQDKMIAFIKKGTLTSKELNEFIKISELNLKDLPFDIRTLNILAYSYKQKGDMNSFRAAEFKKSGIIKAIQSTGNGTTEKAAFNIIDPVHEYDLLKEYGLEYAGSNDMTTDLCEYIFVQPNDRNIRGFYFNLSRILNAKTERNR